MKPVNIEDVKKNCDRCGQTVYRLGGGFTEKKWAERRYCSWQCYTLGRYGEPYTISDEALRARLLSFVEFDTNGGCWLWRRHVGHSGYGVLTVWKKLRLAHRVSWTVFRADIPPDTMVLHKCDVRCCINPDHLFLGDAAANMQDMVRKGRARRATGYRRLSHQDRQTIIEALGRGVPKKQIARDVGFDSATVLRVARERRA